MSLSETDKKILMARYEARKQWLKEHPEATMSGFGHAHGMMAMLEMGLVQTDYVVPEDMTQQEYFDKGIAHLQEKYQVDVTKLPEETPELIPAAMEEGRRVRSELLEALKRS